MSTFTFYFYGDFLATKLFSFKATSEAAALNAFSRFGSAKINEVPWTLSALTVDRVEVIDEDEGDDLTLDIDDYKETNRLLENTEAWTL